jgi:hypothetical protein
MNPALNPEAPKACQECKEIKPVGEFRKYPKGINYDIMCLECRKVVEKKKRDEKKSNPTSPKYPIEPTRRRGRPKKIVIEEVKEDVKEDVGDADKEFRTCEVCGESKELNADFFHKQKNGWNPSCKDCKNAKRREQYKNNPQFRANKMKYQKQYQPQYYANNKEKFDGYRLKYADKIKERQKIYRQLKKEADKLKKQEEFQQLIREEAQKLLQNGGLEMLN